jgi:hypothetical protein
MLSRLDLLKTLSENMATDLFIFMLNPKYRGPKFDFEKYDIAKHVRAMIGINLAWKRRPTEAELKKAGEWAKYQWDHWINHIGEGLPRTTRDE